MFTLDLVPLLETKFDTETWKDDEKMNLSFVGSIDSSKDLQ